MLLDPEVGEEVVEETHNEEEKQVLEAPEPNTFVDRLKHFTWV